MSAANLAPDILRAISQQARQPGRDEGYNQRDEIILLLREIVRLLTLMVPTPQETGHDPR